MIFSKSDRLYEAASVDDSERRALISQLKRRRAFAFRGATSCVVIALILGFAPVFLDPDSIGLGAAIKLLESVNTLLFFLIPAIIGFTLLATTTHLEIKMLILADGIAAGLNAPQSTEDTDPKV